MNKEVREGFIPDWAMGTQGAMINIVKNINSETATTWPTIRGFKFSPYRYNDFMLLVLQDEPNPQGAMIGSGAFLTLPESITTSVPVNIETFRNIYQTVVAAFNLTTSDFIYFIPIKEGGNLKENYSKFSEEEVFFWEYQHSFNIKNYRDIDNHTTPSPTPKPTAAPITIVNNHYHLSDNSRINNNSTDNSVNKQTISFKSSVYEDLNKRAEEINSISEQKEVKKAISEMEQSENIQSFKSAYNSFIAKAANHMTLFSPFIPALTEMLIK